jgi:hypothetical protein
MWMLTLVNGTSPTFWRNNMFEQLKAMIYRIVYWLEPFFWAVLVMVGVTMLWVNK